MITKINHVGIAVNSIEETAKIYTDLLGLKVENIEVVEEQNAKTAIIPVGDSKIELIESTSPEGTIAKYIENRGEGVHHLALEVDSIEKTLTELGGKGVTLIDQKPRKGVENTDIAFVHPKSTGRVLIELVES